ncbi:hypothetical protein HDU81_002193 [Chytriomyces hyalinus]|nr:hypothetical protein HDU81_002193 [Chytriomyces hyalinus]
MPIFKSARPHPGYALVSVLLFVVALLVGALPFQQLIILIVCRDIGTGPSSLNATAMSAPSMVAYKVNSSRFDGIDYDSCAQRSDVQDIAASWTLWFNLAQEIPALGTLIFAGYFVDLFGRRASMLLSSAAMLVLSIAHVFAAMYEVPLALFVFVQFFFGMCGGLGLLIMASSAYIAHTSEAATRTTYFSLQDSSFAVALMTGPLLGGLITKQFGFLAVFWMQVVVSLLLITHLVFVFPDSEVGGAGAEVVVKKSVATVFKESVSTTASTLQSAFKFRAAASLIIIASILSFTNAGIGVMFLLYPAKRFGWDSLDIGQFIFASNVQKMIWLTVLVPWFFRFVQTRGVDKVRAEVWTIRVGLAASCIAEFWFGCATTEAMFLGATSVGSLAAIAAPTMKSLLSTLVPATHQGRLFSSIRIFEAISQLFATVIMNTIYRATVDSAPQTVFFVVSGLVGIASLIAVTMVTQTGVSSMEMGGYSAAVVENGDEAVVVEEASEATPLLHGLTQGDAEDEEDVENDGVLRAHDASGMHGTPAEVSPLLLTILARSVCFFALFNVLFALLRVAVSPTFGADESFAGFVAIAALDVSAKLILLLLVTRTLGTATKVASNAESLYIIRNQSSVCLAAGVFDYLKFKDPGHVPQLFLGWNILCPSVLLLTLGYLELQFSAVRQTIASAQAGNAWPEYSTNVFSRLSFSWMNGLIATAISRSLKESDLWQLDSKDTGKYIHSCFSKERNGAPYQKRMLLRLLLRLNLRILAFEYTISLVDHLFIFGGPFFIRNILQAIQNPDSTPKDILTPVIGMFFAAIVRTACESQLYFVNRRIDVRIRSALVAAIYSKGIERMQPPVVATTDASFSDGAVSNLMSADTDKVLACFRQSHYLLSVPLLLALCMWLLVSSVGWAAALAGMASLSLAMPATRYVGQLIKKYRKELMKESDSRMRKVQEILNGMKTIKLFGWEPHFFSQADTVREQELKALSGYLSCSVATQLIWRCSPLLASAVTFLVKALVSGTGQAIDAATAFTVLAMYNNVLRYPLFVVPKLAISIMELNVSIDRIESFLMEPELETFGESLQATEPKLGFTNNASFNYGGVGNIEPVLKNLGFTFPDGKLSIVIGKTGSGKSSLLMALLGEMRTLSGQVVNLSSLNRTKQAVSYASQHPWLLNATIRENILFGESYEESRYNRVIAACALQADLDTLESGDETNVGDRGTTLSGGQRQRISLARAVYAPSQVVLLDDVLSAVDSKTAKHILRECLLGPLMQNRTRVLVTHAVDLMLPEAEFMVVMQGGGAAAVGSVDSVLKMVNTDEAIKTTWNDAMGAKAAVKRGSSVEQLDVSRNEKSFAAKPVVKALREESKLSGRVSWSAYMFYLTSAGGIYSGIGLVGSILVAYVFGFLHDYSLKVWSDQSEPSESFGALLYYLAAAATATFALFLRFSYQISFSARASRQIYGQSFGKLMHARISAFDTITAGSVMNRFGKDTQVLDQEVAGSIGETLQQVIHGIFVASMISIASPILLVFAIPIGMLYTPIARKFLAATRSLKRLEASTRSPIYSAFGEMLSGTVTIRAFGKSNIFVDNALGTLDANHRAFLPLWGVNRWLAFRVEIVGALVVLAAGCSIAFGVSRELGGIRINPGLAGLVLNYSTMFTDVLTWLVRNSAQMEMTFTSVERLQEYMGLEQENSENEENRHPPDSWPSEGSVVIQDLAVQYVPDGPLALDLPGVHTIQAGQSVGVVGRTGSGKSTFAMSLLRLVQLKNGSIQVDGVDISLISLKDLRERVVIVPQDVFLFAGTIRSNMDPLREYSDQVLEKCLEFVQSSLPILARERDGKSILETMVLDGGANLSGGQCQVISLARAYLKKCFRDGTISKLEGSVSSGGYGKGMIVMDEATASLDPRSEEAMQAAVQELIEGTHLGGRKWTSITIAHRIQTVMEMDRVIVLSGGKVVQDGPPKELVGLGKGAFWELYQDAGLR